jgi:hypothetical protein
MRARAGNARGGRASPKSQANLPETSDNIVHFPTDSAQARDEVAKQTGLSPRTVAGAITVKERGTEEDWPDVISGNASTSGKPITKRGYAPPRAER